MSLTLAERLALRIREEGPLPFDAFQRAALYDPDGGYYERGGRVGRAGDFVTGASWHAAFARCLARVAERLRQDVGGRLAIVDVGAGEGELLGFLAEDASGRTFDLRGVELSERRRSAARARVPSASFVASVEELAPVRGLVVAYELFDALPVRSFVMGESGVPRERRVALANGGAFSWTEAVCADAAEIARGLESRGARLEEGHLFEIRPDAAALARSLASRLEAGVLLVFDYGASARALHSPAHPAGTLESFAAHRVSRDVLDAPGSRDITSWVDFTELEEAFASAGLRVHGLVSQSRFLSAAGIAAELADDPEVPPSAERAAERNAIAKLFAPGGMGESIRVLVASRETRSAEELVHWPR